MSEIMSAEKFADKWNAYTERTSQLTMLGIYRPQFDKLIDMIRNDRSAMLEKYKEQMKLLSAKEDKIWHQSMPDIYYVLEALDSAFAEIEGGE